MPTVLVTGASRGIGAAVVHRLAGAEWDVLAGVRRLEDADPLRAAHPLRVTPVTLTVTKPDDIAALERLLPSRLDAVINNAGVVVAGPVEAVPATELRRQLDVNVVGQIAVVQATLPRLPHAGADRRPRARYVVGRGPRLQVLTSRLLPTALMDTLLRAATGVPRRA